MDRYVVREPRVGADFLQANHIVGFGSNIPRSNIMIPPENMYLGGYGREYPVPQALPPTGYFGVHQQMSSANYSPQPMNVNIHPGPSSHQAQMMSGIDPRYLAAYSDGHAQFIATGQNMHNELPGVKFGSDYENRNFAPPDRSKPKLPMQVPARVPEKTAEVKEKSIYSPSNNVVKKVNPSFGLQNIVPPPISSNKSTIENVKALNKNPSRLDKLKALQKTGLRVFSGPIEKVVKWHKALQEIGVMVIYEIVAKCVSVRPGESCAKNLVVRDDGGPAMQVVYYEIDFLLPEIKPPCTVRVVGRMMPGTCRLQAFSVRTATGDDVATLPRRAAVAAHHVGKLCKEYGITV